jgi:hypothetical protein
MFSSCAVHICRSREHVVYPEYEIGEGRTLTSCASRRTLLALPRTRVTYLTPPPPCSQLRGNHKAALFFFEKAGRYNHAVRIAREAGLDTELAALALQASKRVQLDAAR